MTPEDRLLFACARQNFLDAHRQQVAGICRQNTVDWDAVYSTATLHGVAPLIGANLQQCDPEAVPVPHRILEQFRSSYYRNILRKERDAEQLKRALAFFGEKSIPVMLIKGAALDLLVYDQPWFTVAHDVDLVLKPREDEIPECVRQELRAFLHRSGIEYDFFEHHDVVMNGALPVDFDRIWRDADTVRFGDRDLLVMSPEDMLLAACINSCRKRYFRLKSLCDIAEIVERFTALRWDDLVGKARAFDCHNIVYAALLVTQMTVGCALPDQVLDRLAGSPARASVIRHLIGYLSRRASLASLYPFSGKSVFGRAVNVALVLTYATYRWYQMGRKMWEIGHTWHLKRVGAWYRAR